MKIVFDMAFDSGCWPGPLQSRDASISEAWVGPLAFMNILETQLGLTGPYPSSTERALRLRRELKAQEGFWSRSAERDSIGTAQRLLQWRDDLWLSGWRGEARTERLRQLATLTRDAVEGIPDRLEAACTAMPGHSAHIDEVVLFEPESQLLPSWQCILSELRKQETVVTEKVPTAVPEAKGDLAGSRTIGFEATGDGTLQLLRTFGVLEAAEQAAAWLRSVPEKCSRVVVWPDPVLDAALCRHGLPTLGAQSPLHRNVLLAILPLLLEAAWERSDPQVAAELLLVPRSPIHRSVAWKLIHALQEWPAVGSESWNLALEKPLSEIREPGAGLQQREDLSAIFGGSLSRSKPYPVEEIRARVNLLNNWVHRFGPNNPELKDELDAVARQCQVLSELLDACGLGALSSSELSFLLEQSAGSKEGTHPAQAGIGRVEDPGAVVGAVDYVLVWDLTLSRFSRHSGVWLSNEERDDLRSKGVEIVSQELLAKRDSARWLRPFQMARKRVLCASPRRSGRGEEEFPHPAWDEIRARATEKSVHRLVVARPVMVRPLPLLKLEAKAAVRPVVSFAIGPGTLGPREEESASSLGKLLGCPLAYVLEYCGGLRPGQSSRLPVPVSNLMRGNLSHELIKIVMREFKDGRIRSSREAAERVEALFDELSPRLVGGLYLPGMDDARADLKNRLRDIVRDVVEFVTRTGLEILGAEEQVSRKALGIKVGGKVDLMLGEPLCILDFKWSGATKRVEELERGVALQLAVYGHAASKRSGPFPPVGFVIIDKRRILFAGPAPLPGAEQVSQESAERTWRALERGFGEIWEAIRKGRIEASGNLSPDEQKDSAIQDGVLTLVAKCEYCSYRALCGRAFGEP